MKKVLSWNRKGFPIERFLSKNLPFDTFLLSSAHFTGISPSGKAGDSESPTEGSNPSIPTIEITKNLNRLRLRFLSGKFFGIEGFETVATPMNSAGMSRGKCAWNGTLVARRPERTTRRGVSGGRILLSNY